MTKSDPGPSTGSHLNNDVFYSISIIALAITGFVYLVSKVTNFVRLFISLFIFPALPVCTLTSSFGLVTSEFALMLPTDCLPLSSVPSVRARLGQLSQAPRMALARISLLNSRSGGSTSFSSREPNQNSNL